MSGAIDIACDPPPIGCGAAVGERCRGGVFCRARIRAIVAATRAENQARRAAAELAADRKKEP